VAARSGRWCLRQSPLSPDGPRRDRRAGGFSVPRSEFRVPGSGRPTQLECHLIYDVRPFCIVTNSYTHRMARSGLEGAHDLELAGGFAGQVQHALESPAPDA